jgi:hypothetical protein
VSDVIAPQNAPTPILGLNKPLVDGDIDIWGDLTNANWDLLDKALLTTGGVLTGSLGIGHALPADRNTNPSLFVVGNAVALDFAVNAYLDTSNAWRYLGASSAFVLGSVGQTATLNVAAAGAVDAVVTWGPPLTFDVRGNLGLGVTPPAGQATGGGQGGWMFCWGICVQNFTSNAYYDGTNWRYIGAGVGLVSQQITTGWIWMSAPSGAAGAVLSLTTGMSLDLSGNLTTHGYINAGGNGVFYGLTGGQHAFSFNWNGLINCYVDGSYVGDIALTGWVNSNYSTAAASDARYLFKTGDTCTGQLTVGGNLIGNTVTYFCHGVAGDFYMNGDSGALYFQFASTWYWTFNRSNGVLAWIAGGTQALLVDGAGNLSLAGNLYARAGQSEFGLGGNGVMLAFAPSWYLDWNSTNGTLTWNGPSGYLWYVQGAGDFHIISTFHCQGGGVVYDNIQSNAFNFRWDGATTYIRVDNASEWPLQGTSDERLKSDIAPTTFDCLAAVLAMPLHQYRWRDYSDLTAPPVARADAPVVPIGFIAQRVHEVLPAAAIVGSEEGASKGATTMWSINHNTMLAALCGAVQQLAARLVALENATGTV